MDNVQAGLSTCCDPDLKDDNLHRTTTIQQTAAQLLRATFGCTIPVNLSYTVVYTFMHASSQRFFISCYDLSSFTSKQVKGRIETLRFPWDVVIKFDASLRRSVNAFTQTCIFILTARRNLVICLWKKFSDSRVKEI